MSHIHRIYFYRTVLQHTVCESACRSTDVHTYLTGQRQSEILHCLCQFESASADIRQLLSSDFKCFYFIFIKSSSGLIFPLTIYKYFAGHDHCSCTFS